MKELQEMIFIGEMVLQSKIAQRAAQCLKTSHDKFDKGEDWCSIQSILVAAGNVSKILRPNQKFKDRGKGLRQILKVEESNLLSDRRFRNHLFNGRTGERTGFVSPVKANLFYSPKLLFRVIDVI